MIVRKITGGSDGSENGGTETEEPFDPVAEALKNGFKLSVKAYDETVYACTDYEKFNNGECETVELRVGNYTVVPTWEIRKLKALINHIIQALRIYIWRKVIMWM